MGNLQVGDFVTWLHAQRGGWGYTEYVPGVVKRVGSKRITIRVRRKDGSEVLRVVRPENVAIDMQALKDSLHGTAATGGHSGE
jgi:hypothetical protein